MTIEPTIAKPSNLSRLSVEKLAESISKKINYTPNIPIPTLVSRFGGRLSIKDFSESNEDGSILIKSEEDFEIFIPAHTSPLRDRFTVAHEIGHYVLHFLWAKTKNPDLGAVYATRYGSNRAEWEANWFASAFLMPSSDVREFCENENLSIADMSGHFSVSPSAAKLRLNRLGLLPVDTTLHENQSS